MPVTIQLENPCLTAVLDGEIDHHCARSLREERIASIEITNV